MKAGKRLYIGIIIFLMISCNVIRKEHLIEEDFYAFVGKKISIEEIKKIKIRFLDEYGDTLYKKRYVYEKRFLAKYIIYKNMYNHLNKDTIEFVTYDANGKTPTFINDDYTLFYVSKTPDNIFYAPGGNYLRVNKKKNDFYSLENERIEKLVKKRLDTIIKYKRNLY